MQRHWGGGQRACQGGPHEQSLGVGSPVLVGGYEPTPWATSCSRVSSTFPALLTTPSILPHLPILFPLSQAILSLPSLPDTSSPGC